MEERRFYVYVHKNKDGEIVYVGSGTGTRYKSKSSRSKEHMDVWESLDKIIVINNLTNVDSRNEEEKLIFECLSNNLNLFNKTVKCHNNNRLNLSYEYFDKFFYIDETSPSYLRWKVDRHNNLNNYRAKVGDVAGITINKSFYRIVTVEKKILFCSQDYLGFIQ